MPLFTKTFAIIAGLLSVPVFGVAVIASNYSSPFLEHLADIVQGNNTSVVVSMNAPNWSIATPLYTPIATTVASSSYGAASSGLASSTTWYFEVAALDGNGTTTVSNQLSFTTDASTTQTYPEVINVNWSTVPSAVGYAIYFSTTTPNNFTQYFLATSTQGVPNTTYDFATSTGSLAGSYTKVDTTAFSNRINPQGNDYFFNSPNYDVMMGYPTTTPQAGLDIASSTLRAYSMSTSTCGALQDGAMFYNLNNHHLWLCQSSSWVVVK